MARTVATEPVDHRRATAERNVEAILDAAESLLADGEATSIAAVAGRAGVSRVTVYAHFASREAILQAVVVRAVQRAAAAFDAAAAGAPTATEALERALAESWRTLGRHTSIAQAAAAQLSTDTLRETHESAHGHVRALVERGRADGEFRTDVPVEWLVSVFHALLHSAGDDVRADRLGEDEAHHALLTTIRAAFLTAPRLVSS